MTAYEKPDALGDSLEEFRISLDGAVYEVPVPVSVLIADGWELDTSDSDAEVAAHDIGWVTLRKGGQEIREIAVNYADYATIPENCWFRDAVSRRLHTGSRRRAAMRDQNRYG